MLGNVTKYVWNKVDPRPVYAKAAGAATKAVRYEAFDTSGITSGWFSSDSSGTGTASSWFSSDASGTGTASSWFSSDASGSFSSMTGSLPSFSTSSSLSPFGNPTFTPIPDFSGQSMYNIVFSCNNLSTNPPPTNLTPDQLQKRQTNIGLCNSNSAYFCKYVQDASANFSQADYQTLSNAYCKPSVLAGAASVATGGGVVGFGAYVAFFIGALLCASVVANQMLYMPAIMRIFVFLLVFVVSLLNPFAMGAVFLYYLFVIGLDVFRHVKGIYGMEQFIVPMTILPLRFRRPDDSLFMRILLGPFTYVDPSPTDPGRQDYLNGADVFINNLQRGAKLSDAVLQAANMQGMKKALILDLKKGVEAAAALQPAAVVATAAGNASAATKLPANTPTAVAAKLPAAAGNAPANKAA